MARGRMLDKCISFSEIINDLKIKEAFIYTWIIPHLDDWGRITGSPRKLKAMVFSMKKEVKTTDIENALQKFKEIGLYFWEEIEGELVLQMPPDTFNEHQTITDSKRAKSKFPEIPKNSQELPKIPLLSKDKIREDKIRENKIYSSDLKHKSEPKQEIIFNFSTKEWENIAEEDKKIWKEAYPACDIEQELKKMKAWILSAGAKGHKKNWVKFITNWLSRSQDNGGTTRGKSSDWKTT